MKKLSEKQKNTISSFFKFSLVGVSNTLIFFILYYAVIMIFGKKYYLIGQCIGYFTGTINSYILNSKFVFKKTKDNKFAFLKMCLCYLITYFLQAGLLTLQIDIFKISEFVAPISATLATTVINFFLNKIFTFNKKS